MWYTLFQQAHSGPVHPAYNPYFSAYFFSQNNIFLSQQISVSSADLSTQPNGGLQMGRTPAGPSSFVRVMATVQLTPNAVMGLCQKPNASMFTN
jgi:hypothetical protein